jgi:hypothetical protein
MERGDDQQHSETDCMTTGPTVASGDLRATVEELKLKLWEQVAQLDDDRIDTAAEWMFRLRQMHLADQFDGVDLGVFDGGE